MFIVCIVLYFIVRIVCIFVYCKIQERKEEKRGIGRRIKEKSKRHRWKRENIKKKRRKGNIEKVLAERRRAEGNVRERRGSGGRELEGSG